MKITKILAGAYDVFVWIFAAFLFISVPWALATNLGIIGFLWGLFSGTWCACFWLSINEFKFYSRYEVENNNQ